MTRSTEPTGAGVADTDTNGIDQDRAHWEQQAANWIAWSRKPGHDSYWHYSPAFFEELVPPPGRATLDLACGEGRVTRDLTACGHRVTSVDGSTNLLAAARDADPDGTYVHADAVSLPFDDNSFDLVVVYNALMDFDDMPGGVAEAARVLEPGGRMCVSITHPIADAGRFDGERPDAPFVIEDTYLGDRRRYEGTIEHDGLTMTFAGWAYPLETYTRALEEVGLLIEKFREPAAPSNLTSTTGHRGRWERIPMFLWFRAVKTA